MRSPTPLEERLTKVRGPRPRLLKRDKEWTETQRDAMRALEYSLWVRSLRRPGDVVEVPLTLGHLRQMLVLSGARRSGRDYARTILATLVEMGVVEDTRRVIKPKHQPDPGRIRWWRVFRVLPIRSALTRQFRVTGAPPSTSSSPAPGASARRVPRRTASLCRFLESQGLYAKVKQVAYGSVQAAFASLGPP